LYENEIGQFLQTYYNINNHRVFELPFQSLPKARRVRRAMRKHGAVLLETGEYLNMSHPPTFRHIFIKSAKKAGGVY